MKNKCRIVFNYLNESDFFCFQKIHLKVNLYNLIRVKNLLFWKIELIFRSNNCEKDYYQGNPKLPSISKKCLHMSLGYLINSILSYVLWGRRSYFLRRFTNALFQWERLALVFVTYPVCVNVQYSSTEKL